MQMVLAKGGVQVNKRCLLFIDLTFLNIVAQFCIQEPFNMSMSCVRAGPCTWSYQTLYMAEKYSVRCCCESKFLRCRIWLPRRIAVEDINAYRRVWQLLCIPKLLLMGKLACVAPCVLLPQRAAAHLLLSCLPPSNDAISSSKPACSIIIHPIYHPRSCRSPQPACFYKLQPQGRLSLHRCGKLRVCCCMCLETVSFAFALRSGVFKAGFSGFGSLKVEPPNPELPATFTWHCSIPEAPRQPLAAPASCT